MGGKSTYFEMKGEGASRNEAGCKTINILYQNPIYQSSGGGGGR